jgi:hypothetical protein
VSKRSSFITLLQAATKSLTNFCFASEEAQTSVKARSCECEPKIRSARVAVHLVRVLVQNLQVQLLRPPLPVGGWAAPRERTLAFLCHGFLRIFGVCNEWSIRDQAAPSTLRSTAMFPRVAFE